MNFNMIKHFDTFAGAWWFSLALQEAIWKENIETIWYSEIDKFAIQTYEKNFPWVPNFGSISEIDIPSLPEFDLLTWGFPCQDVSVAGKQSLEWGRTVLVEYLLQILEQKQPEYFVFENVKGLMSKKFDTFRESIFERILYAGYEMKYKVLNTKDFWLPQNRERVFMVWKLVPHSWIFQFPKWQELTTFLKDILEEEVDEKYYLSWETYEKLKKFESNARLYDVNWISPTLNTMQWGHRQPKIIERPHGFNKGSIRSDGISPTIRFQVNWNTLVWWERIRKITPIECERIQGFPDWWSSNVVSNSQAYKQMWNAISIPPAREIFKNLFKINLWHK